ncbi:NAD(P)H-binding protein [Paenibacillus sp. FSL K6-2862]|uniref:NAD(P)H-binding protein n=1 Tax=Paenibacillus sp. FSL K6-2862 TaxID=2921484 RepID=UPI0030FC8EAF
MKVLVTGATGTVGGHIVEQLISKGVEVRGLSRNLKNTSFPPEAQIVVGDLNNPDTLQVHLQTVDRLFLITQSEQTETRFLANQRIIRMAKEANVKKIVALMDYEGNPIESIIQESGMDWTILRPAEFMKNALYFWAETIQKEGIVRTGFPDAMSVRIHEADIAAVAVEALTEEGHHEKIYTLTGPQSLTNKSMITQISEIIGKPIELVELTEEQVRQNSKNQGYDDEFIEYFLIGMAKNPPENAYTVLPTVEQVTGKPARTFVQWVTENKHYFN